MKFDRRAFTLTPRGKGRTTNSGSRRQLCLILGPLALKPSLGARFDPRVKSKDKLWRAKARKAFARCSPAGLGGRCEIVADEIRFWNGAKIYLCHCKDEKDIYKYQGAEIHVLLIDELTHFTETMYRFLRNRVRMVGIAVPDQYAGRFPRILCGANPGNIGHLWVKATFVEGRAPAIERMPEATAACCASSCRRGWRTTRAWRTTIRATSCGSKGSARARWCRRCAGATGT